MDGKRLLLNLLVTLLLLTVPAVSVSAATQVLASTCSPIDFRFGACETSGADAGISGGSVVIRDSVTRGGGETPGTTQRRDNATSLEAPPAAGSAADEDCAPSADPAGCPSGIRRESFTVVNPTTADEVAVTDEVTVDDLVNFSPTTAIATMEPNGWMVLGLHTNFFATATTSRVQTGELLGQPASVRFTAAGFTWDYGDGATSVVGIPGSRWSEQGLAEFAPTATSHVYLTPGTYTIALSIHYTAEYRYAGSEWRTVAGTLTVPTNELVARAANATTVLVERECTHNPLGPGC